MSHDWQLTNQLARLTNSILECSLDLSRPSHGLNQFRLHGEPWPGLAIFRLEGLFDESESQTPSDAFVRGRDLIARYDESESRPFGVQLYWRTVPTEQALTAIDLVVSVQTSLLDVDPELRVTTCIPSERAYAAQGDGATSRLLELACDEPAILPAESELPLCQSFLRSDEKIAFVQMAHRIDVHETVVTRESDACHVVSHRMFVRRLEKGVILRARLRSLFCPSEQVESVVAAERRAFAASELPLTV